MKSLEDFKKELEVLELEDRLEIVGIDSAETETICNGLCCCVE
jgi:hypothetical protein